VIGTERHYVGLEVESDRLEPELPLALKTGPPRGTDTSAQSLYQEGQRTQSINSDQTFSGVAAIFIVF
jgi:hypothetical protein